MSQPTMNPSSMNLSSTSPLDLSRMQPGLADPVHDAQRCFRTVLEALSHPGRLHTLPVDVEHPAGLSPAQAAILLALADYDTPVWLPLASRNGDAGRYLRFHCGCPLVDTQQGTPIDAPIGVRIDAPIDAPIDAQFVVLDGLSTLPALDTLRLGDPAYPDRSATVLVDVPALQADGPLKLRGPGIRDTQALGVAGWTPATSAWLADNHARFPLGADLILSCGDRIVGLPRTTLVEV
ncbi:phosphonate C-P lyase system protein PhnH [Uliginosibacterium sp. H1]|uniref:phosphonate C-P lyase system protein PhnH n=1 Tax=Uliginosibacterium sp. H1 TaxID=3114757 RepID=UPI002E187425|nr:phosphonate C-P lyase system protein PhnH [Uliginosibacterium sp. H1]